MPEALLELMVVVETTVRSLWRGPSQGGRRYAGIAEPCPPRSGRAPSLYRRAIVRAIALDPPDPRTVEPLAYLALSYAASIAATRAVALPQSRTSTTT